LFKVKENYAIVQTATVGLQKKVRGWLRTLALDRAGKGNQTEKGDI
jgi:hypothetical protein